MPFASVSQNCLSVSISSLFSSEGAALSRDNHKNMGWFDRSQCLNGSREQPAKLTAQSNWAILTPSKLICDYVPVKVWPNQDINTFLIIAALISQIKIMEVRIFSCFNGRRQRSTDDRWTHCRCSDCVRIARFLQEQLNNLARLCLYPIAPNVLKWIFSTFVGLRFSCFIRCSVT